MDEIAKKEAQEAMRHVIGCVEDPSLSLIDAMAKIADENAELLMKKIIDCAKDPNSEKIVTLYNTKSILKGLGLLENDPNYKNQREVVINLREAFESLTSILEFNEALTVERLEKIEPTTLEKFQDALKAAANVFMEFLGSEKKFDRSDKVLYQQRIRAARQKANEISV